MKGLYNILENYFIIYLVLLASKINLSDEASNFEQVQTALKEIAYGYYMRGKNIQYNTLKLEWFNPEEATEQNINYLVCSGLTKNVYRQLLNITIPQFTKNLLKYSRENIGKPEVVLYSNINSNKKMEMKIYSNKEKNKYKTIINPSLKDVIPLVQVGDVLTYTGHTFLIFEVETDKNGKVKDAIIMESTSGGNAYVNSKISPKVILSNAQTFSVHNYYLYLHSKKNTVFKTNIVEGTIGLKRLSKYQNWLHLNDTKQRKEEYSILRFLHKDSEGKAILKYTAVNSKEPNQILNNQKISLSKINLDRIKFNHIYIQKTVNAHNNNIVQLGDILNYKIVIKNMGSKMYTHNLIVTENLSKYVTFLDHHENEVVLSFNKDLNKLTWNIGKLKKGQEFIINYTVKISSGKSRDMIISTGKVGNIPSSVVRNVIGVNLNENQMNLIKSNYERLKRKYNGKKLINEVYRQALNYDMRFDEFDITKLIINSKADLPSSESIFLNKANPFYNAVLNKYWSTMKSLKHAFTKGGKEVIIYSLKPFRAYTNPERRQSFIYKNTFKTGDILIYKNENDSIYSLENKKLVKKDITYEEGEYAYIYIEGQGFVGVNLGKDGISNTKDDRNEFNFEYYLNNNLELFLRAKNPSDERLEIGNLQTLFGKDYYTILRPSLCFDFQEKKNNNFLKIKFKN